VTDETIYFPLPDRGSVTAIRSLPEGREPDCLFVYAPGAGSNVHDPFGSRLSRDLAARGLACVRFQFPYMESRRSRSDPPGILEDTWRKALETLGPSTGRLAVGGRSMGGRIASQVVAQGTKVDALALFAYPLHPPGRGDQMRDTHLPAIGVPTLFCSGTRDAFGTPDELRAASAKVPGSGLHLLEGADHGFATLKSSGMTGEDVWEEAISVLVEWLDGLPGSGSASAS